MIDQIFYIFGSPSSVDFNVMVLVPHIPDVYTAYEWCDEFAENLTDTLQGKNINVNLAVLDEGVITNVFKGISDEVNNSIFYTYSSHQQWHPLNIIKIIPRNFHLKLLRVARIVLSLLVHTEHQIQIKEAFKSDINVKAKILSEINLRTIHNWDDQNITLIDFKKDCAFQFGQVFGLTSDKELYTKEDVIANYPHFQEALERMNYSSMDVIETAKDSFLSILISEIPKMIHDQN